jgi:hypothetical protein
LGFGIRRSLESARDYHGGGIRVSGRLSHSSHAGSQFT